MVKGKARAAGSFLGGLANNPAIVIIALVLGGLLIFRDRISSAVGGLGEGLVNIQLPEINLPELPEINFPEIDLPDFSSFFQQQQEQTNDFLSGLQLQFNNLFGGGAIDQPQEMVENTGLLSQTELDQCQCGSSIKQDAFGNVNQVCKTCVTEIGENEGGGLSNIGGGVSGGISDPSFLDFLGLTPAQQFVNQNTPQGLVVPFNDPLGLGGGQSFAGGTTTFGDQSNIVDTLSEVLNIFPNLTASQAANALFANPNLTGNQFASITPIQPSISSAGVDPPQIFNNASGGFSGLTAQQIANILTGGNISNF